MKRNPIIFTDIDGTLVDHSTYSFEPALPALNLIKKYHIPLIFCSSKTRAEIEEYRKKMEIFHPFISENGGGIFIPKDYFTHTFKYTKENDAYKIIELGIPYKKLYLVLDDIKTKLNCDIKGFFDMKPEEISSVCGLSFNEALLSKKREFDEAFVIKGDNRLQNKVLEEIKRRGYQYTKGGRFFHITGENDKGKAVEILKALYEKKYSHIITIGLGDSFNDKPLLEGVDIAVLVKKPGGTHDPEIDIKGLIKVEGIGPKGWRDYIVSYLSTMDCKRQ